MTDAGRSKGVVRWIEFVVDHWTFDTRRSPATIEHGTAIVMPFLLETF